MDSSTTKAGLTNISPTMSRVERYFPVRSDHPARVLLLNPAQNPSAPPLDLLKLSTFLRSRGYTPELQTGTLKASSTEPYAVVLTSVFSWEIPRLHEAAGQVRRHWPRTKIILSGVLPRRLGDQVQSKFGARALDEASESLLDEMVPDYALVPDWDASILITSKGICPRECSHCEAAAIGKGVARLISNWPAHMNPRLARVEVWDNTLMLTPREHYIRVVRALCETEKPVDLVCGIAPAGVEETELDWRAGQLAELRLTAARLECNSEHGLPRFFRLLEKVRSIFGPRTSYRAFAVINGTEPPAGARERIRRMRAEGVAVDIVRYTPHDWEDERPFVNHVTGWTIDDLISGTR